MKGVVFTEFLEMVEDSFSLEIADEMISSSNLESNGVYTTVGTYDHMEMVEMVKQLSKLTGIGIPSLLQAYGELLFTKFAQGYGVFFENVGSSFEMLKQVDNYIHIEVKKLYPEAELPKFDYEEISENQLLMKYTSPRGFGAFAKGLIIGCTTHFEEDIDIEMTDLSDGAGKEVHFLLTKKD